MHVVEENNSIYERNAFSLSRVPDWRNYENSIGAL